MSRHTDPATSGRRVNLVPTRDDLVDAGFVLGLMLLALIGFRTTYSGIEYLVAGMSGAVLGLLIAHLANVLKQPMIAIAAATLAVFFLLGGAIVLRGTALAGILPSGDTFRGLADQSVHGWKDLLTTLPPVDGSGPLLVLPYILGLLGGVGGFSLARRVRPAAAPVIAPLLVLVAVILLGTQSPAAQLLQGGVFAVAALGWTSLRSQRLRAPLQNGSGRLTRAVTVGVLLVVATGGASLIAPHVPGAGDTRRTVLRSYVDPPFDVGQYSSPLAGFRKYTKPAKTLYNTELFRVSGLPRGTAVRIAALDAYDGVTWTAANRAAGTGSVPDTFQRVGREIDNAAAGRDVSYRVSIGAGYKQLPVRLADAFWLPAAGSLTELDFHGKNAARHSDFFRYNLATGTGVVPDKLASGDSYSARAVLPSVPDLRPTDVLAADVSPDVQGEEFKTKAAEWAGSDANRTAQVIAVGDRLKRVGHYTDGEAGNATFLPGHYRERLLTQFLGNPQVPGDDEQFAAAYALMITQLGVPARVVFGALPESDGVVRGRDIHGWVEVQLADSSWRAIPPDAFISKVLAKKEQPEQQKEQQGKIVPPPARGTPRSSLDDVSDAAARSRTAQRTATDERAAGGIPAWVITTGKWVGGPLLVIGLLCALIVLVKVQRRRLRRTRGTPAGRLARGWREIVDHARDLGSPAVLAGTTRKEQAALLAAHDLSLLARSADSHVFGPADPDDAAATTFWREVDATRRRMSRTVGRRRRLRAALNLVTFLPARSRGGTA